MHVAKLVSRGIGMGLSTMSLLVLLGAVSPARATLTATITTDFPATVQVGDTFDVHLVITNTSDGLDAADQAYLTNIKLVPACAVLTGGGDACMTPDPNNPVFTISNVVPGPEDNLNETNKCITSQIGNISVSGTDEILFTPDVTPIINGPNNGPIYTLCEIDFTVHVNQVPGVDAKADPGIQTLQVATADLQGYDFPDDVFSAFDVGTTTFAGRPLFVIGDVEPHAVGDVVNFWGAQWWKNNDMSGITDAGYPAFKGYADDADSDCGGEWLTLPGNSSKPPATIPDNVLVIVTSTVHKDGPDISGDIQQILVVHSDGGYGPNPGHRGNGTVTQVVCPTP